MKSHLYPARQPLGRSSLRLLATILFCLTIWALSSADAVAQCQIGFRPGSPIANASIDGSQGTKWDDASILRSGDPCMNSLPDWDQLTVVNGHAVPMLNRMVRVLSKRDTTMNPSLYMAFDVADLTRDRRNDPLPGISVGPLGPGERIILQFDPDNAHMGTLSNDFRIDVSHIWGNTMGDINFVTKAFSDSSGAPGTACMTQSFAVQPFPDGPGGIQIKAQVTMTGYFIEFKIPLSVIGNPTNDIGVAFAVINDLGYHDRDGNNDATGL